VFIVLSLGSSLIASLGLPGQQRRGGEVGAKVIICPWITHTAGHGLRHPAGPV